VPALEDLEARVAALEASQADYRAVLAAASALGASQRELTFNQRETAATLKDHGKRLNSLETKMDDTNARVRSLEDTTSEIRELLIRALDR
jgi:chaperonin cofactor prefoldin